MIISNFQKAGHNSSDVLSVEAFIDTEVMMSTLLVLFNKSEAIIREATSSLLEMYCSVATANIKVKKSSLTFPFSLEATNLKSAQS